jgi:hypothetical protein
MHRLHDMSDPSYAARPAPLEHQHGNGRSIYFRLVFQINSFKRELSMDPGNAAMCPLGDQSV